MERIMKKSELVDELAARTGFFKKNMKEVVDALADIIEEQFQTAEFGADSELHLAPGVVLKGTRKPAGEAKDPRTGEMIISPEKVIPSATFKQSIRLKLYKKPKGYKKKSKKG
jgi:nucleoid DNA-binding protein